MINFSNDGHAVELAAFTCAGNFRRTCDGRGQRTIAISAAPKTRALPAVHAWIRHRK
jgi:hypothetical protein